MLAFKNKKLKIKLKNQTTTKNNNYMNANTEKA